MLKYVIVTQQQDKQPETYGSFDSMEKTEKFLTSKGWTRIDEPAGSHWTKEDGLGYLHSAYPKVIWPAESLGAVA